MTDQRRLRAKRLGDNNSSIMAPSDHQQMPTCCSSAIARGQMSLGRADQSQHHSASRRQQSFKSRESASLHKLLVRGDEQHNIRSATAIRKRPAAKFHAVRSVMQVILFTAIAGLSIGLAIASQPTTSTQAQNHLSTQSSTSASVSTSTSNSPVDNRQQLNQTSDHSSTSASVDRMLLTEDNLIASSSSTTETVAPSTSPAGQTSTTTLSSRIGSLRNGGDLAVSSTSSMSSVINPQQLTRKSSSSVGNRWTHFGARLRPLSSVTQVGMNDHHEQAASTAKSTAFANGGGNFRPQQQQQVAVGRPRQGASEAALSANRVDDNSDQEEDDDDQDSEALLYKMMQQQNFLMNPVWQDQPSGSAVNQNTRQQQNQVSSPNGNNLDAQNRSEDLANSKKVIKLLKSYSHIHQVDDSDDQIRGTYTRLSSYRPDRASTRNQYSDGRQNGNGNQAINNNHRRQQHIFVSSRPVSSSQTTAQARYQSPQQLGGVGHGQQPNYAPRQMAPSSDQQYDQPSGGQPAPDESQDGGNEGGGPGGPPQEEDEFECPNNGIFADVASGCQSYHVCQSGAQVQEKFQCPLGTLFNDIILTCDFAHNVQCGGQGKKQAESSNPVAQAHPNGLQPQPRRSEAPRHPTPLYPQQMPTNTYSRQQQQPVRQPSQPSLGPRQLVIGSSPYNRHNQQQAPSQAQAIGSYPSVKPLSNAIGGGGSDSNSDEDDDNEPNEPLVAATLPPRVAPQASNARIELPYQAPPPPPTQAAHPAPRVMPSSIQQQIPHQANRQTAHMSQYQPIQRPSLPPQQQQHHQTQAPRQQYNRAMSQQQHQQQHHPQVSQFQGYPVSEPTTMLNSGHYYGDSASSATPVFADPQQRPTEPSVSPVVSSSAAPTADYNSNNEVQSLNLVINHVAPTHSASAATASGKFDEVQRLQHKLQPNSKQNQIAQDYNTPVVKPATQQQPSYADSQNAPIYKSSMKPEPKRTVIKQQQQQQQQPLYIGNQLPPAQPPAPRAHSESPVQSPQEQQQQQHQQQQQSRPRVADYPKAKRYEARREIAPRQQQQQQPAQQRQQYKAPAPAPRQNFGTEIGASQHAAVTHAPPPPRGVVDLTNDKQASVGSDALNDGLLLIVRHSSSAAPIQVSGSAAATAQGGNRYGKATGGAHGTGGGGQAFAVDPTIVRPDSPLDTQLFPNVQQLIAHSSGNPVTQASTLQVSHQSPQQHAHQHHQQAVAAPQAAHAASIQIRGPLPPMEPPKPVIGGGQHENYGTSQHHQRQQRQPQRSDYNRGFGDQSNNGDQLASSATSSAASSATAASSSTAAVSQKQAATAATTTMTGTSSKKQPAQQGASRHQQQQATSTRSKRAKRLKPAQSPAAAGGAGGKPQQKGGSTTTSTTSTTTAASVVSSSSSRSVSTTTSAANANQRANSAQQSSTTPSEGSVSGGPTATTVASAKQTRRASGQN